MSGCNCTEAFESLDFTSSANVDAANLGDDQSEHDGRND